MKTSRLLLCTDMDRTIIANGPQPQHPEAHQRFCQLCRLPQVTLIYVTGRSLQLVEQAIAEHNLPVPEYAITDVGSKIYQHIQRSWQEMDTWQQQIQKDWRGKTPDQLHQVLAGIPALTLQEESRQNDHKLSYYLSVNVDQHQIIDHLEQQLTELGVAASVIYSVDTQKDTGLIDILPRSATKLDAIYFLQHHLDYLLEEIVFAGDSGNDLQVLASPIRSILVANADPEIRRQSLQLAAINACTNSLYLAQQDNAPLGGNYTAGVLQGLVFFFPEIEKLMELS
ncbi:MAG: haloacid dehalogenase [Desulfotalea sp.]|nr:MAG: haloacid dehalogenase [Desulfotalea sp.]